MQKQTSQTRRRFHHIPGTDPYTHQRTRDIQPQTTEDVRTIRRLATIGAAATAGMLAGVGLVGGYKAEGEQPIVPPQTTIVTAGQGDSYWSLQAAEGFSNRDPRDVVMDITELNGDKQVHPDDTIVLLDDPNTPPSTNLIP